MGHVQSIPKIFCCTDVSTLSLFPRSTPNQFGFFWLFWCCLRLFNFSEAKPLMRKALEAHLWSFFKEVKASKASTGPSLEQERKVGIQEANEVICRRNASPAKAFHLYNTSNWICTVSQNRIPKESHISNLLFWSLVVMLLYFYLRVEPTPTTLEKTCGCFQNIRSFRFIDHTTVSPFPTCEKQSVAKMTNENPSILWLKVFFWAEKLRKADSPILQIFLW